MNNTHRYPLRAANGEQLLQKRTKPAAQSVADKDKRVLTDHFTGPNQENSSSFANKKVRRDMSHHGQQPMGHQQQQHPACFKQAPGNLKAHDIKLKKTNPRLGPMKAGVLSGDHYPGMNQRKGKQMKKVEGKDHQQQFMQYPMMPQYPMQYPQMAPQMMPMGMQFPVQQMGPHTVGYPHQNPQIAEMQKQINFLSQMTYMQSSQMAQMHQQMSHETMYSQPEFSQMQGSQFQGSYYPKGEQAYGGIYGSGYNQGLQPESSDIYQDQEEYYEEDNEFEQQNISQQSQDDLNQLQDEPLEQDPKKMKGIKRTPISRGKNSSKLTSPSKQENVDLDAGVKRGEDTPNHKKHNQTDEDLLDQAKLAPNSKMRDHSDNKSKNVKSQSPREVVVPTTRHAKKAKLQEIHDNRNIIDDGTNVRRTTRSMLNKGPPRRRFVQAKGKESPKKPQTTPTKVKAIAQSQGKQVSNSRSPKGSPSKDRTPRKQRQPTVHVSASQDESSVQITHRETRYSSRLSSAKQSSSATGLLDQKQKELQSLKEEIEVEESTHRELLNKQQNSTKQNKRKCTDITPEVIIEGRRTRGKATKKSPSKDEHLLFGNDLSHSQKSLADTDMVNQCQNKNKASKKQGNPLSKKLRKEAQTEIVDRRLDDDIKQGGNGSKSVCQNESAEEDAGQDDTMKQYIKYQQEKERIQKEIANKIFNDQQLKDMSLLFGMTDDEIQAIKKQQDEKLQKLKDQLLLFGDQEMPGNVNEFLTPNSVDIKKEQIKTESQLSDVRLTKVVSDNRVIDVDQVKEIKTEQEEILLFNDNSTTQEQHKLIKDEMVGQIYQQNADTQDVNIVLEVQKPIESESQDLKLEKSLVLQNDPSSTNGGVLQINHQSFDNSKLIAGSNQDPTHELPRFNEQDEQMLFNEHPNISTNVLVQENNKSSDLIQTSLEQMQQQSQIRESFDKNEIPSHNAMIVQNDLDNQEQDDTFKIDNENHVDVAIENERTEELPDNQNDTEDDRIDDQDPVQEVSIEQKPNIQPDSIHIQKDNLMKQIEKLQQQIEEDKKKLDEHNQILNAQKEPKQREVQEQAQNENLKVHDVELDQIDDDDQTMQDQDDKDFEVNLEHDNAESQNYSEENDIKQIEMVEPEKDITDLVDHLPLPDNYEQLITFVSALDQGMNILQSRQIKTNFVNLRNFIQSQTKRNFTIEYLKQILFIQPSFYLHSWEFKKEKYDLNIQIPKNIQELLLADDISEYVPSNKGIQLPLSQTLMRARATHIRKLLLKRVYTKYQQFMSNHSHRLQNSSKSTPQQHQHFSSLQADHDIFATRRWPGLFDLNNPRLVPEIPTQGIDGTPLLKELPNGGRGRETVQDFVHRNDTKDKIREAVEEANRQHMMGTKVAGSNQQGDDMSDDESNQLSDSSDEARRMSMKHNVKTGVDEKTLAVVRMKEQMDIEAKEKAIEEQKRNEIQKNIESHIKCSEQIKQLFQFSQGSTMKFVEVRQKIHNAQISSGSFISIDQLNTQIQNLIKILPDWIRLITANNLLYIRLSKNLGIQQFEISNRIKQYFMNLKQKQPGNQTAEKQGQLQTTQKRERLDSEQARLKQQVMEKQNEPQRQTKSCPPVASQKQQSNYAGFGQQHSGQERSLNQSALSQKSNSLSNHQQEMQSPSLAEQVVNLSNQQYQMQKKNNQSAFQPFQKVLQSQSVQSQSETPVNQARKTSTEFNGGLDSEMATEQHHSGTNLGNTNVQYFGSGARQPNTSSNQQQHIIQPSSNSVFKQVTPQSQKGQTQSKSHSGYSNGQYHDQLNDQGETGDLNQMNFGKTQQHQDQGEQSQSGQRSGTHSANRYFNNKPSNGSYNNLKQAGNIDNLLKQVMSTSGDHGLPKNYSPVKRDTSQPRTSHNGGQHQSSHHHQNIYESNSISASMGPIQFGNDLYQGLQSSSRGRGQSGSPYGAAPSQTTAQQPSILALNDDVIEDGDNTVTGHQISGANLSNYRNHHNDFQQNNFGGHHQVSQQHHARNRMNSGDREQNFGNGRYQHGHHHGQQHSYY